MFWEVIMNLLIVDDEYYTVESISNKIRTLRPDFFEIFCAYNLTQALEAFSAHPIDLMICDIEMPGGSGLELLDQIRQAHYETVCIFLTAYAKFEYISRAMKLSSSDYLLKPLDDHALLEALDKACAQCEKQQKDRVNTLHANYWKESELPLAEQFFLDLLNGSISSAPSEVMDEIRYRRLNVELIHQPFCPLLIQTGQKSVFAASDNRTLYEFALKNIAREYFFEPGELPLTIRVLDGFYLLLLPVSTHSRDAVIGRCRQALTDFVTHFPFSINFFVDQKVCLPEDLRKAFLSMKAFAGKNVTYENHVFDLAAETEAPVQTPFQPIPSDRWSDLLTSGKTEQLQIEVFAFLNQTKSSGTATREFLTGFYYQFLQLLFRQMDHPGSEDEAFRRQIDLSLQYGLPIAVHTRDAWPETVTIMREYRGRGVRGVFHAYSDGIETYRKLKECGDFVFGIGGVVTFKKSRLAEVAGEMELRDLVLETDCPYLTPAPHRGERNESAWVRYVCEKVAQIKGLTPEEVAEATTANAERMFGRPQNRPAPSHGRKIFDAPEANRQAAAPPCGGLPATAFRADPRELPPENATEVPENESSDHASPSSDNGLSRPERA